MVFWCNYVHFGSDNFQSLALVIDDILVVKLMAVIHCTLGKFQYIRLAPMVQIPQLSHGFSHKSHKYPIF